MTPIGLQADACVICSKVSLTLTLLLQLITGAFVFPLLCMRGSRGAGHEGSVGVVVWWVWVFDPSTAHSTKEQDCCWSCGCGAADLWLPGGLANFPFCLVQRHGIPACRKGIVSGSDWHILVYAQPDIMQGTPHTQCGGGFNMS